MKDFEISNFTSGITFIDILQMNVTVSDNYLTEVNTATTVLPYGEPQWKKIIEGVQFVITCCGLSLNILTIFTLQKHKETLYPSILTLLQHQSLLDSWICIMAIVLIFQPYMWQTGNPTFDLLVCQVWHGQGLYWGCVLLSVYNLVLIAVERYTAVCKPFLSEDVKIKRIHITFGVMYVLSIVLLTPAYLQTRYTPEGCLSQYYFPGETMHTFMFCYGIFWFMMIYAGPCGMFLGFYGKVLYKLRQHRLQKTTILHIIDKVNRQVTRTLIIVTVFFIVTLGWDSWYYLLGYVGIVDYEFNSPLQMSGVFLSVVNSCLNPVVYLITMPVFRTSVHKTVTCFKPIPDASRTTMRQVSNIVTGIVNPAFVIDDHHVEQQNSNLCNGTLETQDIIVVEQEGLKIMGQSLSINQEFFLAIAKNMGQLDQDCALGLGEPTSAEERETSLNGETKPKLSYSCSLKRHVSIDKHQNAKGKCSIEDNPGTLDEEHGNNDKCVCHENSSICIQCSTKTELHYYGKQIEQKTSKGERRPDHLIRETLRQTVCTNICIVPQTDFDNVAQVKVSTSTVYTRSHSNVAISTCSRPTITQRCYSFVDLEDAK